MRSRPNVLLVVADDQRFDTVAALGNDVIETPNLDELAESGVAFTRHHNEGADQGAVCVPARSMIHSGRSLFRLEGPGGITTGHPPLPGRFDAAGFRTFATGKWHNGIGAFDRCFAEGSDVFFGGMANHWNVPVASREPGESWPEPRPHRTLWGTGTLQTHSQVYDRYASGTHSSELFADAAIDFLRDHDESDDDRPFFGYVATMAPHDPRTCPGEYLERYGPDDLTLSENFRQEHPFDLVARSGRDERLEERPLDREKVRRHLADYYAMITHLDAQVGRILDALEAVGEREDTVVVFTADHGLAVGRHGLMGKQNCYEHSVRVPLLIAGPGIPAGERNDALSSHPDLYPTLCQLAGLSCPGDVDGESLVPTLTGDEDGPRDAVFLAYGSSQRAIREDRLKLVEYDVAGDRRTQLFDLHDDPAETVDRSGDHAYASDLERLRGRLARERSAADDPANWTVA